MFPRMRDHKAFRERRAHTKQQQNGLKEIARRTPRSHRSAVGLVGALGETPGAEREILRQEGEVVAPQRRQGWRVREGEEQGEGGVILANNATDKSLRKKRNRESKSDARAEAAAEVKFNRLCAMGQRCLVVAQSPFGTR